ncbi:alpha/beta fold hydrolase [Rhizorhapis suberifaciens]|uniref:Pimeloyl-ACP methyl ester carboxylesterase n=1 Tax=Rhizorhapis suberifaciens TaxID=13656 RepID=A0A840HUV2_9SPHN|nr:alpha/beta fold hydrolase [Rhizorhapis suberifaciens]MBB4641318.1 pimeloyl-ACP methyl ester carboxylesterase [Rhizorhapis suberifaciens]
MADVVLVHGSMHGAWCWDLVTPLLADLGHTVQAIDLPGQGADTTPAQDVTADDWAEAVACAVRSAKGPVVLVGHSMGGTAVSQGAERVSDRVRGIIYISAIMIPAGETILSACPEVLEIAEKTAQEVPDPASAAIRLLYGHTPPELAAMAIERLRPQPEQVVSAPIVITDDHYGRIPRAYIECEDDGIVPLAVQRRMQQALPCSPVVTMPGDHSPFLSAPSVLARHVDQIAREFCS